MRTRWQRYIPIEDPDGIYCPIRTTMKGDCRKELEKLVKEDKKYKNVVRFNDITDHIISKYHPETQFSVAQRYTTNDDTYGGSDFLLKKINDPIYNMIMLYDNRIYIGFIQQRSSGIDIKFQKSLVFRTWTDAAMMWENYIGTSIRMI